jgi:hypothetical protein
MLDNRLYLAMFQHTYLPTNVEIHVVHVSIMPQCQACLVAMVDKRVSMPKRSGELGFSKFYCIN